MKNEGRYIGLNKIRVRSPIIFIEIHRVIPSQKNQWLIYRFIWGHKIWVFYQWKRWSDKESREEKSERKGGIIW